MRAGRARRVRTRLAVRGDELRHLVWRSERGRWGRGWGGHDGSSERVDERELVQPGFDFGRVREAFGGRSVWWVWCGDLERQERLADGELGDAGRRVRGRGSRAGSAAGQRARA